MPRAKRSVSTDSIELVRKIALSLPGVEEVVAYRMPAFRVRGKMMARTHPERELLFARMPLVQRMSFKRTAPEVFMTTRQSAGPRWIEVRLATLDRAGLEEILRLAWEGLAPKPPRRKRPAG